MMNAISMRDGLAEQGVGFNTVAYHSEVQTWKEKFTTNNNTSPYAYLFWDLSNGPIVVDMPGTHKGIPFIGTWIDQWHRPMEVFGPSGFDDGLGGKYIFLPPGYDGELPIGHIPVQSKTYGGYSLIRPIVPDFKPETMANMVELVKKIQVYPLSEAANPPATKHVDIAGKSLNGLPEFDASYFTKLHKVLQEEKLEERDMVALGMLRELGIEKGKPFVMTKEKEKMFNEAAKDAHAFLIDEYLDHSASPTYEGKLWSNSVPDEGNIHMSRMTWQFPNYLSYNDRGAGYYAFYSSFVKLGSASYYLKTSRSTDGQRLNGSHDR